MPMPAFRQNLQQIGLILLFAVIAMAPAFFNGVPSGNDQAQHYQFAWTVFESVKAGDIYPSFASDTNHGFGDYGLRFYPPLTYYALAMAYAVVQDWYYASLLAFTLVFFLGGFGVFLWARTEFERPQALIAAMLYVFAPYHLNEIYNNFLLAEFFATALIPFCFLFLTRACREGKLANFAGLSVAYSLLILTHLPMTIICSLAMGIYALVLLNRATFLPTFAKLSASVGLSIVMTSFYWSRWLPELGWITHSSPKYFATTWDYRTNFLLLPDHFLKFGEDALNLWFADILLISTLLLVVPTIIYLVKDKALFTRIVAAMSLVLGFSVIMTTPLSGFVWDNLGFLQKVQFPWRFLAIISAFAAMLGAVGIIKASVAMKSGNNIPATVGLAIVLFAFFFTAVFVTRGAVYVSREKLNGQMANVTDSEGCDCWWPVWARREAFEQTELAFAGTRKADVVNWSPRSKQFVFESGEAAQVNVRSFYYPRWSATVNGSEVAVVPSENGTISVAIPADRADVTLTFREPAYVLYTNIASLLAWLVVFGGLLVRSRRIMPVEADA